MKKLVFAFLFCLIILGCKEEPKTSYVIEGTAKGVFNGIRVHLNKIDERGRLVPVDTAIVMNEKFVFTGSVNYPTIHYISVNGISGRKAFIIENKNLELYIDNKIILKSRLKGSKSNDDYQVFNTELDNIREQIQNNRKFILQSGNTLDTSQLKEIDEKLKKLNIQFSTYPYQYIKENNESFATLPILNTLSNTRNVNFSELLQIFNNLNERIKESKEGKRLLNLIQQKQKVFEINKTTAIGATAPEFSAPNPKGENISLKDVVSKGKITMIDFWAAWCGPCRRENPNVVKVYEKYHDKGLEIIGVGLDGRRGQKKPKEAWIKAIEDDKLNWHQVSNLRYFDEIAKSYNVNSIPSMFILDNEGKIIAKNLRGLALEKKIAELLN